MRQAYAAGSFLTRFLSVFLLVVVDSLCSAPSSADSVVTWKDSLGIGQLKRKWVGYLVQNYEIFLMGTLSVCMHMSTFAATRRMQDYDCHPNQNTYWSCSSSCAWIGASVLVDEVGATLETVRDQVRTFRAPAPFLIQYNKNLNHSRNLLRASR